jgi:hypothetical protein
VSPQKLCQPSIGLFVVLRWGFVIRYVANDTTVLASRQDGLWFDMGRVGASENRRRAGSVRSGFAPDAVDRGLDLRFEMDDQLPVGFDQRLLGLDLGDDGALGGEVGEGN